MQASRWTKPALFKRVFTCNGAALAHTSTIPNHEACSVAVSKYVVMPLASIEDALKLKPTQKTFIALLLHKTDDSDPCIPRNHKLVGGCQSWLHVPANRPMQELQGTNSGWPVEHCQNGFQPHDAVCLIANPSLQSARLQCLIQHGLINVTKSEMGSSRCLHITIPDFRRGALHKGSCWLSKQFCMSP